MALYLPVLFATDVLVEATRLPTRSLPPSWCFDWPWKLLARFW
jgi:hypothetical protein